MTDPLDRELAARVAAATPSTPPSFDEISRRVRRHRARSALAVAAGAAVVVGVAVGGWSLRSSDPDPTPEQPVSSQSPTPESTPPGDPEPTYDPSGYPSGLVIRLPEGDVELPADTSCWTGPDNCRRALLRPGDPVPDVGPRDAIDFWFARPGWEFSAILRRAGEDCPRATTVEAAATDDQWFRLTPADEAGSYEVELYGNGPDGSVSARFLWTTTSDGPLDPPTGGVDLFPESRGEGSYGLEVALDDLGFQPARSELSQSVDVTVTAADGQQRILTAPLIIPSLECGQRGNRGSFYYQMEWDDDISVLGPQPFDLEVVLTIRDTTHVGRATWRARNGGYSPIDFTPPLPGAEG